MEEKYYVYEWFIIQTGEIFYVGKGTKNRYRVKSNRNSLFLEMIQKHDCDSRIIKRFKNEKDAFEYEKIRIDELKKIGQCACNIHTGGAGGSGDYWTDDLRKEYSEHNVMKRPEQRKRMSNKNPMKNPKICEHVNSQKRVPVIINNIEYESIHEAHKMTGYSYDAIRNWCDTGNCPDGISCSYKSKEHRPYSNKSFTPFTYKGNRYTTFADFYDKTNIPNSTLKNWLRAGFDPDGNICRRDNDARELIYLPTNNMPKKIIVNGMEYPSISDATKKLGLRRGYISEIIRGIIIDPNYVCIYDNQQPSQGNFKTCTLEGSETTE